MSYDLDRAVKQLQTTVTRLDLKQARVRRVGSSTIIFDGGDSLFSNPDQANEDTAGGSATVAQPPIPDPLVVQSAYSRNTTASSATVVLPATPIEGNTLILWQVTRDTEYATGPAGWTAHPSGVVTATAPHPNYTGAFFYKVVTAGQSASIVCPINSPEGTIAFIVEVEGLGDLDVSSEDDLNNGDAVSVSLTPTGPVFMIGGVVIRVDDNGGHFVTPDGNSTELFDQQTGVSGESPLGWAAYRVIDPPGGAFTLGGTVNQAGRDWGGQALAFDAGSGTGWVAGPFVNDGDDATCEFVPDTETEVARIVLSQARAIVRARLNIKIETAGSVTYELQAATQADFSDATTVASATFTATGSFTAQDVEFDWASAGSFRYWQLVGPGENIYICALELYELAPGPGVTDHGALTGLADDDHSAYLTVVGGGKDVIQAHGVLGATETIDLVNGNVHSGTLDQACTLTTTGWTNLRGCTIRLALLQNGTGNWLPTISGVTWITAAPIATAAGTVIHVLLFSDDGGTVIWGSVLGTSSGALDDLSDVTITSPAENDTLRYVSGDWVNDNRRWEPVTFNFGTGPELVWDGDDLVMEWKGY